MKALSDYLHSKGLLLGIYGDSGEAGSGPAVPATALADPEHRQVPIEQ